MPSLFSTLGSSLTDAGKLGNVANLYSVQRDHMQRLAETQARTRAQTFGAISQLLGIGNTVFRNIGENRKLIDFAEDQGFSTKSTTFSNIFGTPKFERNGEEFDRSFIMTLQKLKKHREQKNLLDVLELDSPNTGGKFNPFDIGD